jgi:plasmid maintenance system killer protein
MEISFTNKKLAELCNSEKKLRAKHGPRMARLIGQRLLELSDAETLEVMKFLPGARCHELTANLQGLLAVDLVHPDRLAFKPDNEPIPKKPDGGLDWAKVTKVLVVGIGDYH